MYTVRTKLGKLFHAAVVILNTIPRIWYIHHLTAASFFREVKCLLLGSDALFKDSIALISSFRKKNLSKAPLYKIQQLYCELVSKSTVRTMSGEQIET